MLLNDGQLLKAQRVTPYGEMYKTTVIFKSFQLYDEVAQRIDSGI